MKGEWTEWLVSEWIENKARLVVTHVFGKRRRKKRGRLCFYCSTVSRCRYSFAKSHVLVCFPELFVELNALNSPKDWQKWCSLYLQEPRGQRWSLTPSAKFADFRKSDKCYACTKLLVLDRDCPMCAVKPNAIHLDREIGRRVCRKTTPQRQQKGWSSSRFRYLKC